MAGRSGPYKAAVVQAAPVFLNRAATVDKCIALIEQAAAQGARLIAFPETFIPGYPWWIWLGSPAWGMRFVQRYHENALEIGSVDDLRLREAARQNRIWVLAGFSERDGGSLYMAQSLISPEGELVFTRRKLKPTHVERSVFGEGDGSHLIVAETEIGRIGALNCWEHFQPLTKYAMYSMNEQVHVASWPSFSLYRGAAYALGPELNNAASQMYAAEGQCFVLAPCATVSDEMIEMLVDSPDKQPLLLRGGGFAMAYGPDGRPLNERLPETEEGLILVDIDLGAIALAKSAADPTGHYARPDVTRLLLNRAAAPRVVTQEGEHRPAFEAVQRAAKTGPSAQGDAPAVHPDAAE